MSEPEARADGPDQRPEAGGTDLALTLREDAKAIRRGGFVGSGAAFAQRLEDAADRLEALSTPGEVDEAAVERMATAERALQRISRGIGGVVEREEPWERTMTAEEFARAALAAMGRT